MSWQFRCIVGLTLVAVALTWPTYERELVVILLVLLVIGGTRYLQR